MISSARPALELVTFAQDRAQPLPHKSIFLHKRLPHTVAKIVKPAA
jgi:hypothetical protein